MSRPSYDDDADAPTPPIPGTPGRAQAGTQEGFPMGGYAAEASGGTQEVDIGTPEGPNEFNIYICTIEGRNK